MFFPLCLVVLIVPGSGAALSFWDVCVVDDLTFTGSHSAPPLAKHRSFWA